MAKYRLLTLLFVLFSSYAYAADGVIYKDAIVITTVEKVGVGDDVQYRLSLPFQVFGQDIVRNGQMVTYSLDKLEGLEVMAKVDYKAKDEAKVKSFIGYMPDPLKSAKYATYYPITKADALATEVDGVKIPYNGQDKLDPVEFCQSISMKLSVIGTVEVGAIDG